MRLIAERLLPEVDRGHTYLQGELSMLRPSVGLPSAGKRYHCCCSPNNRGALAMMQRLDAALGLKLQLSDDLSDLESSERFLVYLNKSTWTAEPERLACDVRTVIETNKLLEAEGKGGARLLVERTWASNLRPSHLLSLTLP